MNPRSWWKICFAVAFFGMPAKLFAVSVISDGGARFYVCKDGAIVNVILIGGSTSYADLPKSIVVMGPSDNLPGWPVSFISKETGEIERQIRVPLPEKAYPLCTFAPSRGLFVSADLKELYFVCGDDVKERFRLLKYLIGSESSELIDIPKDLGAPQLTFLSDEVLLIYGNGGAIKYRRSDSTLSRVVHSRFFTEYSRAYSRDRTDFWVGWKIVPGLGYFIDERSDEGFKLRRLVEGMKVDKKWTILLERGGKEATKAKIAPVVGPDEKMIVILKYDERIEFINLGNDRETVTHPIFPGTKVEQLTPWTVLRRSKEAVEIIDPLNPKEKERLNLPPELHSGSVYILSR